MISRKFLFTRAPQLAALVASLLLLLGLAYFAYAGTFARYWADDYCYSATIKQDGLLRGLVSWYQTSGNRFTTPAVVAVSDLFGRGVIAVVPAVVLAIWLAAWGCFIYQATRLAGWRLKAPWIPLLALIQVYFIVLLAPDRLQTVYWRMGAFHYSLPLPLLLLNLVLLTWSARSPRKRAGWIGLASGLLACFAAGLSETFAALQTGLFGLALLATLIFLRGEQRSTWAKRGLPAFLGSLLAMGIMLLSPSNAWRSAALPPPDNLFLIIPYSLRYAVDFIFYSLRGQLVPFAVYFVAMTGALLLALPWDTIAWLSGNDRQKVWRFLLAGLLFSLVGMYGLIVCSFAPSVFAGLQYPAGRALMPGAFALLAGLASTAFFCAAVLRRVIPARGQVGLFLAAFLLILLAGLYPIRAAAATRQDVTRLSAWADRWDARNTQILQQLGTGQMDVRVRQTDVVQSLEDIGPEPSFWINACASVFYGARSIQANP